MSRDATAEALAQALAALLPQGPAWPREPGSVWMRLIGAQAALLAEHHALVQQAAREWLPHLSVTRLAEWEAACGLPDDCTAATQTLEERRARLLARLRGPRGAYDDSSPAAPEGMAAALGVLGIEAQAVHATRFRAGRDRVGRRVGRGDGVLWLLVQTRQERSRVGVSRCGERLIQRTVDAGDVLCAAERVVPARFEVQVAFVDA